MDSRSRQPTAAGEKLILTPVLTLEGHKACRPSIAYFPDGKRMVSGSRDKTTRRWDLEAGKEIEEMRDICEQEVVAVGVSRDGRWVVTAGGDLLTHIGELKVCEVETGIVRIFEGYSGEIDCIDISADSTLLAVHAGGSGDHTVWIWSLETGKLVTVAGPLKCVHFVDAIRFSQDSKKLAVKSWSQNTLEVWDVATQSLDLRVDQFFGLTIAPVFWTTEDKTIVTTVSITDVYSPKTIHELDASTLAIVGAPFEGHTDTVTGLALSSDCALLASAAWDDTIKLWAFESRQLLASFDILSAHCLIFSPDSGELVYTTMHSNNIYLCNTPPDILASTHSLPQVKTSTPGNMPIADSGALSLIPNHSINPSSTVGSQVPLSRPEPCNLNPSSSHMHMVFSAHNIEPDNIPSEVMLQDLSEYITKDGDYAITRGGFGEIWKCTLHIDRRSVKVAVKALQVYATDQLGAAKTKKINRIKRELRICANLKHVNILPVYGYTYGFGPFLAIVSPWAENGNLSDYLEREHAALTLLRRFEILRDIIAGLQYLHANNVIHGDFTGPNVLIHGDGTACIADFGLSLMYSEVISVSQASWTSNLKGNVRWMAPELLVEQEDGSQVRPSEQSNMYSFGGIILQVLTNKVPYYYLSNDAAIILCIAKSQTPSRSRYPELPEQYWQLIEQCWSTHPWDRLSTEGVHMEIKNEFYSLSRSC